MKLIYEFICLPLLHINSNVYSFFSGIVVSVATNIFTSISLDNYTFVCQWTLYISSISFLVCSGLLLYIATKIAGFQEYANDPRNKFNDKMKDKIIYEATKKNYKKWVNKYFLFAISLLIGIIFLLIGSS